jgi:hypothetical protein
MDFNAAMAQAWNQHADAPNEVAARWPALRSLIADEAQIERLAALMHHVHGTHLAEWQRGSDALQSLRALAAFRDDGSSGQALRRTLASLATCAGAPAAAEALSPSDRIRVGAMAAESLGAHDPARAAATLRETMDLAQRSGLPDDDPMHRSLAAAANGLASTFEAKPDLSTDERALMILAAQAARHHWERAGTWLEVERAEYRLAMTWLQAGDPAQARQHAQTCLEIVGANQGAALERFFGWEALGAVERAAGNALGHARALGMAHAAFGELSADDQGWCQASLDKLAADAAVIITSPAPG